MKRVSIIIILFTILSACKNDKSSDQNLEENRAKSYDQNDGLITIKGDFIYYQDAAVLQTPTEIYGVVVDENMHELNEKVTPHKKEATDMVPVTVRVKRFESNQKDTWKYKVEIKEILKVEQPVENKNDVIKLSN